MQRRAREKKKPGSSTWRGSVVGGQPRSKSFQEVVVGGGQGMTTNEISGKSEKKRKGQGMPVETKRRLKKQRRVGKGKISTDTPCRSMERRDGEDWR